jgi:hypothetical protein
MAKVKVLGNTISGTAEDIAKVFDKAAKRLAGDNSDEKLYIITKAAFKGLFCNYSYEFATGDTKGDECDRKGSLIVHDDMKNAFKKLHAHLAVICEEVDGSKIRDIETIEEYDEDEHKENGIEFKISKFYVDSFTIKGTGENLSVILSGSKMLSTGDYVALTTPKRELEGEYKFANELRVAIDDCVFEVEEYMKGKSKPKMIQPELPGLDGSTEGEGKNESFDQTTMD